MENRTIRDLSAGLLPHRLWAISRWFYANPIWYYHRRSLAHEIRLGGRFFQLVDPELREVCRLLNEAGARTTPSCQGHSYPRGHFERIWEELRREEPLIRGQGLAVKDSENDEPYLYRQSDYEIPWRSFGDFYREAAAHQNTGYLGILVPVDRADVARALEAGGYRVAAAELRTDEQIGELLGGTLFEVRVETPDPVARAARWRQFTNFVSQALTTADAAG